MQRGAARRNFPGHLGNGERSNGLALPVQECAGSLHGRVRLPQLRTTPLRLANCITARAATTWTTARRGNRRPLMTARSFRSRTPFAGVVGNLTALRHWPRLPLLLLLLALSTVFLFGNDRGYFYRPGNHNGLSSNNMTVAANRSLEHNLLGFIV